MEPVGQDSRAHNACRFSVMDEGWAFTNEVPGPSPKTEGAICRQASQSMQVESTKKSPGTFSGTRFRGFAMTEPPFLHSTVAGPALVRTWPGAQARDLRNSLLPTPGVGDRTRPRRSWTGCE